MKHPDFIIKVWNKAWQKQIERRSIYSRCQVVLKFYKLLIIKEITRMKKLLVTAAAIAVMATSITANAVSNYNGAVLPNQPSQNITAVADKGVSADDTVNVGSIEYTRTSFVFTGTGETIVTESWLDPETLEGKTNEVETSAGNKVEKNYTVYRKDGAKHYINIQRDQNGKAVSAIDFSYSDGRAKENSEDLKRYDIFAGRKAMYKDMTFWKDKGTVASEGKSLRMLLCGDEKNGNTTIVYIDESTGFPVKEEAFVDGKPFSTMTYEFKYVESDDKLFDADTEGVEVESEYVEELNEKALELKK